MKKLSFLPITGILVLLIFTTGMTPEPVSVPDSPEQYADITVKETAGLNLQRPVTGGIPLAEGAAPSGSRFVLLDKNNKPVPFQNEVLARWKDGSVRWILLDFQARPQSNGSDHFRLVWDPKIREAQPSSPVKTLQGKITSASSGAVKLTTVPGALLRISNRFDVKLVFTDKQGKRCEGVVESAKVETNGKLRSTLLLSGSFRTPEKQRVVDFRLRASVYAGMSQFYLEPQILINSDNDMIRYINDLSLEFIPLNPIRSASIGGNPGWSGSPSSGSPVRLFQVDDENYRFEGASGKGGKAPGWMEINDGKGAMAIALRDFWQQWPKSLEVDSKVARLGLFPKFEEGTFAHMEPWYKHDYLFEGNSYRLREGQSRRWQVWIDLSGNGDDLARSVNMSLVAAADPVQAIATGEWGFVAPAGSRGMAGYDIWADNQFEGYCRSIREQRDYGAMNWGDWWGERGVNWGNHEYDTPLHILTQFARTGDPKYFYVGEQTARHLSEVDIVHFVNAELKKYFARWESKAYPSRPGMMHEHSIGHVGGFHPVEKIKELYVAKDIGSGNPDPYLCLDPFNLGHIFTLGMAQYYLLTGDPWVKESVNRIGDNLMKLTEDGLFQFKGRSHVGRESGWTMLALAGEYKINPSERCLKAMKRIADDALIEQNPNCGGWLYSLPWGHCYCVPVGNKDKSLVAHVGEAGFINSIRLNGLSYYYRLTGDDRIPNSVLRGINFLNNDTWNDFIGDWRYTSCPATKPIGQIGVTIMAVVNSVMLNNDPEQLRILKKAWDAKFARLVKGPKTAPGSGKTYGLTMYGSPEAMNLFVNGNTDIKSERLKAVQTFADNVLKKGLDRWSGHNTPLLADGINVNTGEPIEYVYDGKPGVRGEGGAANHWIIHNLASQQNLFRTLVGLTNLTGDKKYREAAEKSIRFHFDSLRSESGLLRWGGHQLIDLRTFKPIGHAWRTGSHSHELKDVFPFYELMWDVDREATSRFIRAFWNAHVLNWETLEFNRHGGFNKKESKLWENEFKQQKPFFEADGLTFLNTGSDLIYAGGILNLLNGEEGALKWSKLLAEQYVRARHPVTGLGAYQFSKPTRHNQPPEGPLTGLLTFSGYGDRAENQFGRDFPGVALEGWALFEGGMYTVPALMQMELAERLGDNGKEFLKWTVEGLKAYARYGYNAEKNSFRPMWADGTDLTDYAFSRTGYYGPQGRVLKPSRADELYLFSYARAYRLSKDPDIWKVVRSIIKGLQLGDPGPGPGQNTQLNLATDNSNPYAIFALLELNKATEDQAFLKLAEVIGDNILKNNYRDGFFLTERDKGNARFNAIEPLALLSLEGALRGKPELIPVFSGGTNHMDLKTE